MPTATPFILWIILTTDTKDYINGFRGQNSPRTEALRRRPERSTMERTRGELQRTGTSPPMEDGERATRDLYSVSYSLQSTRRSDGRRRRRRKRMLSGAPRRRSFRKRSRGDTLVAFTLQAFRQETRVGCTRSATSKKKLSSWLYSQPEGPTPKNLSIIIAQFHERH